MINENTKPIEGYDFLFSTASLKDANREIKIGKREDRHIIKRKVYKSNGKPYYELWGESFISRDMRYNPSRYKDIIGRMI